MHAHDEVLDLIGAWALDACDPDEAARVDVHLAGCPPCAAQARRLRAGAGWLAADRVIPPPRALRHRVLATARAARPPTLMPTLVGAYAGQAALLDGLLGAVRDDDWARTDPRHETVGGVVAHLAGNDAMLAADLGLAVVPVPDGPVAEVHAAWREQSRVIVDGLAGQESALDQPVRLAHTGPPPRRPLRDALVQRAFETWIHLDDIGAAVGRGTTTPPPEQVRRIVDLAAALLPEALEGSPAGTVRLVLDGAGGGEWTLPCGPGGETTIFADAVEFTRLVANRRSAETLPHSATGSPAVSTRVLSVAATLGCD
ncbi:anti-sigma factor family protein [Phytohabitans kaempferiae]|uniref:Anti-sigma factor family protein n=1 Tax=Phytohabitans kaempferiae TaxID=1620943 RepID=A0ABV6LYC5_9ACTN